MYYYVLYNEENNRFVVLFQFNVKACIYGYGFLSGETELKTNMPHDTYK